MRIVGIGRNEYIATMNKCKAKKLLWRVNKAIVREHLPAEPLDIERQPWWLAHVVNLGAPQGSYVQTTCQSASHAIARRQPAARMGTLALPQNSFMRGDTDLHILTPVQLAVCTQAA